MADLAVIAQIDEGGMPRPPVEGPELVFKPLQDANEARETFLQEDVLASELVQAEIDDFDPKEEYSDTQVADAVEDALEAAVGDTQAGSLGELVINQINDVEAGNVADTNIVINGEPLEVNFAADNLTPYGDWNGVMNLQDLVTVLKAQEAIATADINQQVGLIIRTAPGDVISLADTSPFLDENGDAIGTVNTLKAGNSSTSSSVEGALETARVDVTDAVGVLDDLDDTVDYAPENGQVAEGTMDSFDSASRTLQDTFIAESQAVLTEVIEAAEAEVSDITGLSGRIATLQTRKAEFEAALEADFAADAALDNETAAFNAVNAGAALSGDATPDDAITFDSETLLTREGDEWSIADDANTEREGIDALLADVQAAYDANQAKDTAEDRFQTAIERVVEAEQGDDFESFEAAADQEYTIESAEDGLLSSAPVEVA